MAGVCHVGPTKQAGRRNILLYEHIRGAIMNYAKAKPRQIIGFDFASLEATDLPMSPRLWIFAAVLNLAFVFATALTAPAVAQSAEKCSQDMTITNNWWAAVTDCTQAIAQNSRDDVAYVDRCQAYINLGNYTRALADCTQAITLNPKNEGAYVSQCYVHYYLGRIGWVQSSSAALYNSAVADCTRAIALDPKNEGAYLNRCDVYIVLGNYNAALGDCTQAIELNANNKDAYLGRGLAYEGLDNKAAAVVDFQQVLKIDPSNQTAQTELTKLSGSDGSQ